MLGGLEVDELHAALDASVGELLSEADILAPPIDALLVARRLGLLVAADSRQAGRARCVWLSVAGHSRQGAILVRPDGRSERLQWSVAHEIGEHHVHTVFVRLGVDPLEAPPQARERMATALGNRLLLPTPWFAKAANAVDWDLTSLKQVFATASHELIARRMVEFNVPALLTIVDQGQVTWRRATAGRPAPKLRRIEQEAILRAAASGEVQIADDEECNVRVWPIHEEHWKREIARTTPRGLWSRPA